MVKEPPKRCSDRQPTVQTSQTPNPNRALKLSLVRHPEMDFNQKTDAIVDEVGFLVINFVHRSNDIEDLSTGGEKKQNPT